MATTKRNAAARQPAAKKAKAAASAEAAPAKARAKAMPKAMPKAKAKAQAAPGEEKSGKPKKPKLVRDSFTIPKNEVEVLAELKQRAARLGRPAKKSEVIRAGVQTLAAMGDAAFLAAVGAVPAIKTGRPAKA